MRGYLIGILLLFSSLAQVGGGESAKDGLPKMSDVIDVGTSKQLFIDGLPAGHLHGHKA